MGGWVQAMFIVLSCTAIIAIVLLAMVDAKPPPGTITSSEFASPKEEEALKKCSQTTRNALWWVQATLYRLLCNTVRPNPEDLF